MKSIQELSPKNRQKIYEIKSKISRLNDNITDLEGEINDILHINNLSRSDFDI